MRPGVWIDDLIPTMQIAQFNFNNETYDLQQGFRLRISGNFQKHYLENSIQFTALWAMRVRAENNLKAIPSKSNQIKLPPSEVSRQSIQYSATVLKWIDTQSKMWVCRIIAGEDSYGFSLLPVAWVTVRRSGNFSDEWKETHWSSRERGTRPEYTTVLAWSLSHWQSKSHHNAEVPLQRKPFAKGSRSRFRVWKSHNAPGVWRNIEETRHQRVIRLEQLKEL